MAATLNTVWYVNYGNGSSTGYYALTAWATGASKTVGQIVRQSATPTVGNERCFICIVAGTTHASTEPTWTVTKGAKNTDNTVTWQECSGQPAVNGDVTNTPASSTERSQSISLGLIIKNNAADHYHICTTAGTCGAGEPTYSTTTGGTTTDSGVTWTCIGAVSSFTTAWAAPMPRICVSGLFASNFAAQGDTIYMAAQSAEVFTAFAITQFPNSVPAPPYTQVLCVSNTPSLPPVAADITTGASLNITGTGTGFNLQGGNAYFQGIAFNCGTSSSGQALNLNGSANAWVLVNCALALGGTGTQTLSTTSGSGGKTIFVNTPVSFAGTTGSRIQISADHFIWRDTPTALSKTGSWPATLFNTNANGCDALIENVDLSAFAGTSFIGSGTTGGKIVISHCKLPSITPLSAAMTGPPSTTMDLINCDSGGNTYRHERYWYEGTQTVDTSAVRTGGASDGTTAYSWKIVTSVGSAWVNPFESLPIAIWNTTTGSNRTVTIEAAYNGAALPNNDELWLDVVYFGASSSTQGTRISSTKATILTTASALSSSTALWGGSASARQNTHAYALGDLIGVSSASSIVRLFVCTSAGTSNGSLPGGYASAVDGGAVTDSGATFRAVERCQLSVTMSAPQPQAAGYFLCYIRAARVSSTYWVDPYVTLS